RHYAPAACLVVVPASAIGDEAASRRDRGERVGVIERAEAAPSPPTQDASARADPLWVSLPPEPAGFSRGLYAALHALDDEGCETILVAEVPADPAWAAVRDRLTRASEPPS